MKCHVIHTKGQTLECHLSSINPASVIGLEISTFVQCCISCSFIQLQCVATVVRQPLQGVALFASAAASLQLLQHIDAVTTQLLQRVAAVATQPLQRIIAAASLQQLQCIAAVVTQPLQGVALFATQPLQRIASAAASQAS